jgi:hypothetical protein
MLKPMKVAVEKDLSGGVKITLGETVGLMSPEQAFEFGMVVLKAAGVGVEIGAQFPGASQKHFRAG